MPQEQERKSKFIDFQTRRSVHIALYGNTHKELRKTLVDRSLSMQELFQRFSELVLSGDKKALKILDDLERDKKSGNIQRPKREIDRKSKDTIYDLIAKESELEIQQDTGDEDE